MSDIFKYIIFADDTTVTCSGDCLKKLIEKVTIELGKLKICCDVNKLSFNQHKTKLMVFGNRKIHLTTEISLRLDNMDLQRVNEHTFLGVIIDHKFSWETTCESSKI